MKVGKKVRVLDHTTDTEIVGRVYSMDEDGIVTRVAYSDGKGLIRIIETIDKVVVLIKTAFNLVDLVKDLFRSIFGSKKNQAKLEAIKANGEKFNDFKLPKYHYIYNNTIIDFESFVSVTNSGRLIFNLKDGRTTLEDAVYNQFISNKNGITWTVDHNTITNVVTLSQKEQD